MSFAHKVMPPAGDRTVIGLHTAVAARLMHPLAGCQTSSRGNTGRRWRVGLRKARTGFRQPVNIRRLCDRVAVTTGIAAAVLIGDKNDHIFGVIKTPPQKDVFVLAEKSSFATAKWKNSAKNELLSEFYAYNT